MPKRQVIESAEPCPFCGCEKIFLKAKTEGVWEKRFAVSLQCSRCHVHGPQVFSEWKRGGFGEFQNLPNSQDLINQATEKWNTRRH